MQKINVIMDLESPPRGLKRKFISLACAVGALGLTHIAALADQSDWFEGFNNKVRLIGIAKPVEDPTKAYYAGVEIQMSSGFKTYWRNPGEAGGIPPEFDWAGSENLAAAQVFYPAPHRLVDKAGTNIGYKDAVIFPVLITPSDPAKPVTLHLKTVYGVCKNICIPAEADLTLDVSPSSQDVPALEEARKSVPKVLAVGATPESDAGPVLTSWQTQKRDRGVALVLDVADVGETGDVFLFSPDGTYLPMTRKISASGASTIFEGDLSEGAEIKDLAGKSVVVTMVGAQGQSESSITLPKDIGQP